VDIKNSFAMENNTSLDDILDDAEAETKEISITNP